VSKYLKTVVKMTTINRVVYLIVYIEKYFSKNKSNEGTHLARRLPSIL